jgi:hypothetical protein
MKSLKKISVCLILLISPFSLIAQNSWTYFLNNLHYVGPPQHNYGLAIGWNYSGGDGESLINYGTGLGSNPRLKFTSYDGSLVRTELTLKGGKLGFGTENPTASIDIMGTDENLNSIRLGSGRFSMGGNAQFSIDAPGVNDGRFVVLSNGNVGIGKSNPSQKLEVNGTIKTKEVNVTTSGWADYVFAPGYNLRPLSEVEAFITKNGHLPNVPTEKEVMENGVNLLEMNIKLLEKVEELTLYVIELKKEIVELKAMQNK